MQVEFFLSDNKKYICLVKQYKRAKHARLRRTKYGELVLVLPKKFYYSKKYIVSLLQAQEEWIYKTATNYTYIDKNSLPKLDKELNFQALQEIWSILYPISGSLTKKLTVDSRQNTISIAGVNSDEEIIKLIKGFVRAKAKSFLLARLDFCCEKYGFDLKNETKRISFAKTRWGSYTKKTITLNARLIFLPIELVDYVIVHELCHAIHLNHSKDFYSLLEQKIPQHEKLKQEMKKVSLTPFLWAL